MKPIHAKAPEATTRNIEEWSIVWCARIANLQPGYSYNEIRSVFHRIVARAKYLERLHPVDGLAVAKFLLERSQAWVAQGIPLSKIPARLPNTLEELGMLKLAEGGPVGGPLTDEQLKPIRRKK